MNSEMYEVRVAVDAYGDSETYATALAERMADLEEQDKAHRLDWTVGRSGDCVEVEMTVRALTHGAAVDAAEEWLTAALSREVSHLPVTSGLIAS